jgi:membrane protein DedA with SNARE-associated domain
MDHLLAAVSRHGYLLIFLLVFAEACGLPVPAALALVAGGAAAAAHILSAPLAFLAAMVAMIAGDTLLFVLGRYTGWGLLSLLCSISLNPETCILRSAESFYKRGRITLVFAKFIPGVNTMAPPLAGSMRMKFPQFLALDLAGSALYILAYGCVGYLFRDLVDRIVEGLKGTSYVFGGITVVVIAAYAGYRLFEYRRHRISGAVPRVAVEEVVRRLASSEQAEIILADVRSHGYYDAGAARIAGSIRIEPNRLSEELENLPRYRDIYLYCT